MRTLFYLLAIGLLATLVLFHPHLVVPNADLAPVACAVKLHAAVVCDFGCCVLDVGLR